MQVTSGSVTVGGQTIITDLGNTRYSLLAINGGTFTGAGIQVGGDTANVGDGFGELLVSSGVLNTSAITLGDATETGATSNVFEAIGGTTNIGSGGIVSGISGLSPATNTVNLGASTVGTAPIISATASWSSSVPMTLANSSSNTAVTFQTANG